MTLNEAKLAHYDVLVEIEQLSAKAKELRSYIENYVEPEKV